MNFEQALDKLWPRATKQTKDAIKQNYRKEFAKAGFADEPLVICHFMAQISHECAGGTIIRENMNYRAKRIMEIFGVRKHSAKVTEAEAEELAGNPEALAERVYGLGNPTKAKELGNIRPGDGFRYRGGGMLQLTGGYNYKKRGEAIGYNLYERPEQLDNPTISFKVAVAEFAGLGCIAPARSDNIVKVTKLINGGRNGLADRSVWLRRWKECLDGVEAPAFAPRAAELDAPPSLLSTRTGQIGAVTTAAGAVSATAQIGQSINTVTDTVQTVTENGVQVVATVKVVNSFLGLSAQTWMQIGIGAGVAVVVGVILILAYRWIKIKERAE